MNAKWQFLLSRFNRQLWVRAASYGLVSIATALVAALLGPYLPLDKVHWLGADAVKDLLTIMASSMLAVATFSLSVMVSAFAAASSSATPRASTLLIEDRSAQRALSTFIGAFLFSIVGLIALSTGAYGPSGRVVMFGVTVVMIGFVVVTLMNWIDQLARFGRVGETVDRVEAVTERALEERARRPRLGGAPAVEVPERARPLVAQRIGYVQHLDVSRLQSLAGEHALRIHVALLPGAFTHPGRALLHVEGEVDDALVAALCGAFTVGGSRTFDQDPRFGLIVLAEIASRALSPAVNDPGTAIDVLGTVGRLLCRYAQLCAEADNGTVHDRVHIPDLGVDDLFDDVFMPIARDGAAMVEVGLTLQRVFGALVHADADRFGAAARRHAGEALARAQQVLTHDGDRQLLAAARAQIPDDADTGPR
jgi:uncharacterized membrane protein